MLAQKTMYFHVRIYVHWNRRILCRMVLLFLPQSSYNHIYASTLYFYSLPRVLVFRIQRERYLYFHVKILYDRTNTVGKYTQICMCIITRPSLTLLDYCILYISTILYCTRQHIRASMKRTIILYYIPLQSS